MNADKHIVTLLQDIRDLVQVLVMREHIDPATLDISSLRERHGRSWSLLAHREDSHQTDESDDSAADREIL